VTESLGGKVAFIAGGSSGINLAIARRFAREGARVMLLSRGKERLEAAALSINQARGGEAAWIATDVRDADGVRAALDSCASQWGPLDIVVSGAAGNFVAPAAETLSSNGFKSVIDIDLLGTYNVFKHSFPYLVRPGASLIAISAPQALNAMEGQAHVAAAKAGVNALVRNLALEWGPAGIRVNAISPGFIADTEGTSRLVDTERKAATLLHAIPLRRLGEKNEIAELALFLVTGRAAYITGAMLPCDGGFLLAGPGITAADDPVTAATPTARGD
jgi:NAD(P)-dependent dehydrogenase (short-subunit alcohol dehydrogenase family)